VHSLYAAENAVSVRCHSCFRVIDLWFDHGLEFSRDGVKEPRSYTALCPDCLLATYPEEDREKMAQAHEDLRLTAREANIPPSVTTYILSTPGKPGSWSDGFLAVGFAVHIRGWDGSACLRQPYVTFAPHDPKESEFTLVFFAGRVYHRDVGLALLKLIWPFDDLSLPERFEVVNGMDPELRYSDLTKLMHGREFWGASFGHRGRLPGTGIYEDGEEGEARFLQDLERVLTDHERRGVRINNQEMLADFMPVGKTTLNLMFNRVPQARERFKQHKRSVRRAPRR
jgi:hypothetical protein